MDFCSLCLFCGKQSLLGLVRQFEKWNCAKWKMGMCFSTDVRQIIGKPNPSIITMEQQVKTCKVEEELSEN